MVRHYTNYCWPCIHVEQSNISSTWSQQQVKKPIISEPENSVKPECFVCLFASNMLSICIILHRLCMQQFGMHWLMNKLLTSTHVLYHLKCIGFAWSRIILHSSKIDRIPNYSLYIWPEKFAYVFVYKSKHIPILFSCPGHKTFPLLVTTKIHYGQMCIHKWNLKLYKGVCNECEWQKCYWIICALCSK